ncbi:MAG TPA: DUF5666 domain-containing protein [Cellvibrio sp.]
MTRLSLPFLAAITMALLSGCGGSGGAQTAGIDGSGAPVASTNSNGAINGFGSVIVNGVKYESDKAQVLINGQLATEDDLRVGYQVSVTGTITDGKTTAEKIEFVPTLVGEITAIEPNNKLLVVLGKTVHITNNTLFDAAIKPASLAGLTIGQRILVSGAVAADGSISATRIELSSSETLQLTGLVANLTGNSFNLGDTNVVYSGAQLINLDGNRFTNGARVTAIGVMSNNQLQATLVIGLNKTLPRNLDNADIEGFVTRYASATDFDVAGISATTTNQTRIENGSLSDLRLGATVEIEGSVNANGVLVASKLEFEQVSNNKISGTVTGINLVTTTGIISGTLEVDGVVITTTTQTRYEDKKLDLKRFNLGSLLQGDQVEVTGYSTATGFVATKIEREEADDNDDNTREFEGVISAVGPDYFMLFGRKIFTTPETIITRGDDNLLSLAAFYLIALNQQIEVRGYQLNGEFYATEIELDDEDQDDDD